MFYFSYLECFPRFFEYSLFPGILKCSRLIFWMFLFQSFSKPFPQGILIPFKKKIYLFCCCYSVSKVCPTLLWPPRPHPRTVAHQTPLSFTISWSLHRFMSIESMVLSNHLISCCLLLLLPSSCPASGFFPMNWLLPSDGKSTGASASASVLPKHWFPLRFTGLVSLKSKRLPGIFSSTIIQKHRFFSTQPSLWSNFHILIWLLEETIAFGVGEDSWESLV